MAVTCDEAPSTIADWKRERRVPAKKQPKVLARGQALHPPLNAEEVMFPFPEDREIAR